MLLKAMSKVRMCEAKFMENMNRGASGNEAGGAGASSAGASGAGVGGAGP
ncbi:hypothetical protein Tco_0645067, partial [Tanacetum coccineum]